MIEWEQTSFPARRTVGALSLGVVEDVAKLGHQIGGLVKLETTEQLGKFLHIGLSALTIICVLLVGLILIANSAAYLISDSAGFSLAGSFGLVGGFLLAGATAGGIALGRQARRLHFFPWDTIEQIKENFSWTAMNKRNP